MVKLVKCVTNGDGKVAIKYYLFVLLVTNNSEQQTRITLEVPIYI